MCAAPDNVTDTPWGFSMCRGAQPSMVYRHQCVSSSVPEAGPHARPSGPTWGARRGPGFGAVSLACPLASAELHGSSCRPPGPSVPGGSGRVDSFLSLWLGVRSCWCVGRVVHSGGILGAWLRSPGTAGAGEGCDFRCSVSIGAESAPWAGVLGGGPLVRPLCSLPIRAPGQGLGSAHLGPALSQVYREDG